MKEKCDSDDKLVTDLKGKLKESQRKRVELMKQAEKAEGSLVELKKEKSSLLGEVELLKVQLKHFQEVAAKMSALKKEAGALQTLETECHFSIDTHWFSVFLTYSW